MHRFNADGPAGLINLKAPGGKRKLTKAQRAKVAEKAEQEPISAIDGVVRWRLDYFAPLDLRGVWGGTRALHDLEMDHDHSNDFRNSL